jgi:hypothetical protein
MRPAEPICCVQRFSESSRSDNVLYPTYYAPPQKGIVPDRSLTYPGKRRCVLPAKPAWFRNLPHILAELEDSPLPFLDRHAVQKLFRVEERRARQLLTLFAGPEGLLQLGNAAGVPRERFLQTLRAFAQGEEVVAAEGERRRAAEQLQAAKTESAARQFRIMIGAPVERPYLEALPKTITWRRTHRQGPARFEILYDDGADLAWQIAEFMRAASANRHEFFEATEPSAPAPPEAS